MGACSSCLGQRGRDSYDDVSHGDSVACFSGETDSQCHQDEENRLLYDDANGGQYGSFGEPALSGDDTLEAQRENEALQRVVAKTSKSVFFSCHSSLEGRTS